MNPRTTIPDFDVFLAEQGLRLDAVVIGGTALGLLGVVSRHTRDCDILHPELPLEITAAAKLFASIRRSLGDPLAPDWLNNGPSSLTRSLPPGWYERRVPLYRGVSLTLHGLCRLDLLRSKLFALCDRGIDLPDCVALAPSTTELTEIEPWLALQDGNPDWPAHVRAVLAELAGRIGHAL